MSKFLSSYFRKNSRIIDTQLQGPKEPSHTNPQT